MSKPMLDDKEVSALQGVLSKIGDASRGLPEPVFEFALAITPMINVDLLVDDEERGVLLAWREDEFGSGWHVPGGIVRLRESFDERLRRTAEMELGCAVTFEAAPLAITQMLGRRGHFISLLYRCRLLGEELRTIIPETRRPAKGELAWFKHLPEPRYPAHRRYIENLPRFSRTTPTKSTRPSLDWVD